MAFPKRRLGEGEQVVVDMRTHGKALIWPGIWFVCILTLAGLGFGMMPPIWADWGYIAVAIIIVILLVVFVVAPIIRWRSASYTITNRRIVTRKGVFNRSSHDLPLARISDVSCERSLSDRFFGCGTMVVQTSAEEPLELHDVPNVLEVERALADLLYSREEESR
ncbi:MAG: hypothetical protein CR980_01570 [Propionibacteriales bacterium]|nr:MAG: hypothetical protein CR980_01570 [Propionibacteriales bacterium]